MLALGLFNLALYITRSSIAGDVYNATVDGQSMDKNSGAPALITITLIGGMIGCASGLVALLHYNSWSPASQLIATGVGMIACNLDLLGLGYAAKMFQIGGDLDSRLELIGVFAIVQAVTQAIYVGVILKTPTDEENTPVSPGVGVSQPKVDGLQIEVEKTAEAAAEAERAQCC